MNKPMFTGAMALSFVSLSLAQTSVNLDFNGASGNTVAATGFDGIANQVDTAYRVNGAGFLVMETVPGDTYGQFEDDPDTADNLLFSNLDTTAGTVVEATVSFRGLNANFHGGGITMFLDTDHIVRFGALNTGGDIRIELLRENEDLWTVRGGPGGDIIGNQTGPLGASGIGSVLPDVRLRIVRSGGSVSGFYSLDGVTFTQVGAAIGGFQTASSAFTESTQLKVGVFAIGGGVNDTAATLSFDSFSAQAVPEPASMAALALGAAAMLRRRKRA